MAAPTYDANLGFQTLKIDTAIFDVPFSGNDFVIKTNAVAGNIRVNLPKVEDLIAYQQKLGVELWDREYLFAIDGDYNGGTTSVTFYANLGDNIAGFPTATISSGTACAALQLVGGETWLFISEPRKG